MNKDLQNWYKATDKLAKSFADYYFGDATDVYWISGDVGGVLVINDYFFGMTDIVDYIQYKYSEKDMFDHYEWRAEETMKNGTPIYNIKNWRHLRKKVKPNK
jgi:hypothetical protein